ncbi:MAG: hydantoinase/oxoprolinase family protein [Gemmataceae bacterium]
MTGKRVLGLDIGGANLKAADGRRRALNRSFPLWKTPNDLGDRLRELIGEYPETTELAVVMTGELCDCFATKAEGVAHIVRQVYEASKLPTRYWTTDGAFISDQAAIAEPERVAAANWHALAAYAGQFAEQQSALLLDIGSTTTDIIPIAQGKPASLGRTDPERLRSAELVYTGVRRTPLCAIFGLEKAAEFFATMDDVYLLLDETTEKPKDTDSADGRPRTRKHAHARIARMECDDTKGFTIEQAVALAEHARDRQLTYLAFALQRVLSRSSPMPKLVVTSGEGEFLAPSILARASLGRTPRRSLADELGPSASSAACAFAVCMLASEAGR